jgi:5'/3'-nucleotidase SurE
MQKILVTNDDGIDSEGIKALAETLSRLAEIVVVAPSTDMTATGRFVSSSVRAITLPWRERLRIAFFSESIW